MTVYVPVSYTEDDYRPSWTGNYTHSTATIRGIFDSMEKAEASIEGWDCADDYHVETFHLTGEDEEELFYSRFYIDYDDHYLYVFGDDKWGIYALNEIVDEEYSTVYVEEGDLGVTDW